MIKTGSFRRDDSGIQGEKMSEVGKTHKAVKTKIQSFLKKQKIKLLYSKQCVIF